MDHRHEFKPLNDHAIYCRCGEIRRDAEHVCPPCTETHLTTVTFPDTITWVYPGTDGVISVDVS